ncbi:MAG TPA: N-acetylmuramic acid 6-phosphate etherase [Candidatus Kapabacteria bacterium]|nr:N-acetylmuramic acid 6-phosphate etherase [Candidatus Kapabacteria bacterium]
MPESELYIKMRDLPTEQINQDTKDIDTISLSQLLYKINNEDLKVAPAVREQIPNIEKAVEFVVASFKHNASLVYVGAGTSGRLGVVDASECPPTFGSAPNMVRAIIAGGNEAMFKAQEGAEDKPENAIIDLKKEAITKFDTVCGIAASGRTPYIKSALDYAKSLNCKTILITTSSLESLKLFEVSADIIINVSVGPEVVAGSTRMKSGTAQKLVLNMISTAAMVRLGKTYENVMIDLQLTNNKLKERAKKTIMNISGVDYDKAEYYLELAHNNVKTALMMILSDLDYKSAKEYLDKNSGFLKLALDNYKMEG